MKKLTAQWLLKAEDDAVTARRLLKGKRRFSDQICFHCQQAIEKYLKAVLQELGLPVPHTHDITGLLDLLIPADNTWRPFRRGTAQLSRYVVEYRYPGMKATARQASSAFAKVLVFRAHTRQRLGLSTRA
jgi:HEPN domain-containing protein